MRLRLRTTGNNTFQFITSVAHGTVPKPLKRCAKKRSTRLSRPAIALRQPKGSAPFNQPLRFEKRRYVTSETSPDDIGATANARPARKLPEATGDRQTRDNENPLTGSQRSGRPFSAPRAPAPKPQTNSSHLEKKNKGAPIGSSARN